MRICMTNTAPAKGCRVDCQLGGCDILTRSAEDGFDLSKYNFVIIGGDIHLEEQVTS